MRFLKNKIAQAQALRAPNNNIEPKSKQNFQGHKSDLTVIPQTPIIKKETTKSKKVAAATSPLTPEASRETKNIVKNYGKAICKFIASRVAWDYLDPLLLQEQIQFKDFMAFVNNSKKSIDGLYHFRSILLESEDDDRNIAAYKRVFKAMGEVFIKYFSVNWVFHSKIQYREAHLKFRYKMLRRIKSPELFTYLKSSKDKKKRT